MLSLNDKKSDEQLLVLVKKGKIAAFDVLYLRYSQRLLYFFYRMLNGDKDKAQDFLQETFLRIFKNAHSFNPARRFSTWVYSIAYNLCKNEYRRMSRNILEHRDEIEEIHIQQDRTYEQKLDDQFFVQAVFEQLQQLKPEQKSAFILRFQENLSTLEISEILDCPEGTVKSRLFYVTKKLAKKLYNYYPKN
ncbi:sigma-70 family RNA polymerase sigma factor [candidate division KSB1 bacterium]|nr:sigma-70 family RNA polymerase sigma factor [candidate division KSB1 bacterium]